MGTRRTRPHCRHHAIIREPSHHRTLNRKKGATVTEFRRTDFNGITREQIEAIRNRPRRDFDPDSIIDRGPGIPCPSSNNPRPGQFDAAKMSQNRVADYKRFVAVDGEGIRCSLYVSGCMFNCEGCFSVAAQEFSYGFVYDDALEEQIIADLRQPFVQGLTILGGEPMANTNVAIRIARRVRDEFGHDKDIWCWTGFTWEELHREGETPDKMELLKLVDVLVDGRYMAAYKSNRIQFRGSTNQRVIDVQKSLEEGKVHIWDRLHDQSREYEEWDSTKRAAEIESMES